MITHLFQLVLISYTITAPFLFLWFHKVVLKEAWDGDMADKVTIRLYVMSVIGAQLMSYWIQECH